MNMTKALNAPGSEEIMTIEEHVKSSEVYKNMNSPITLITNLMTKPADQNY